MRKTEHKEIDGIVFTVSTFGYAKGRAMFSRLLRVFGPALGALQGGGATDLENNIGDVLQKLISNLDDSTLASIADEFASHTTVTIGERTPILKDAMEEVFSGALDTFFKWLLFAIQVNYKSFMVAFQSTNLESLAMGKR